MKVEKKLKEVYQTLFDKYDDIQLWVAVEELSELQKAICKYIRAEAFGKLKQDHIDNLAEETADVLICLEQITVLFNMEKAVAKHKNKKIDRIKKNLL